MCVYMRDYLSKYREIEGYALGLELGHWSRGRSEPSTMEKVKGKRVLVH